MCLFVSLARIQLCFASTRPLQARLLLMLLSIRAARSITCARDWSVVGLWRKSPRLTASAPRRSLSFSPLLRRLIHPTTSQTTHPGTEQKRVQRVEERNRRRAACYTGAAAAATDSALLRLSSAAAAAAPPRTARHASDECMPCDMPRAAGSNVSRSLLLFVC